MAEGHAEDAPLLGSGDPSTPDPSTPVWPPQDASGRAPTASTDQTCNDPPWPPDPDKLLHVPLREGVVPPGGIQGHHHPQGNPPGHGGPKLVRSQSSMDSGCECDGVEQEGPPTPGPNDLTSGPVDESLGSIKDPAGLSPLSPSQPGGSVPPSPGLTGSCRNEDGSAVGPTEGGAPHIAECDCETWVDSKCNCDKNGDPARGPLMGACGGGTALTGGCPGPSLTHTDRGLLPREPSKVTFCIEGEDDDDDDDDDDDRCGMECPGMNAIETASLSGSEPGEDFREQLVRLAASSFPRVPSYTRTGVLSTSSSTASMPMCRICHLPQGEGLDTLISPCRCAGTMQFIHQGCLMKWLEISSKRCKKAPACELCNYQFLRHKKFRMRHWKVPHCTRADKILHSIFLLCLIIMATCATITIICFRQDRVIPRKDEAELTKSEVVTLTCGVLFFVAFFVAMYVEVKARNTLYRLFTQFLYLNQTWHIAEYDKRRDALFSPV
ncbi:uncharacterized protein LOC143028414 [Oratosquilla oratoria]|uniref:uncharacterized protein LOC143028414 n=1 Tax=Oratosquilla oratoria TaxID=337810 RepID=UPI003F772F9B